MRTNVYVDGLNLYYGALRGTPYKWLDIGGSSSSFATMRFEIVRDRERGSGYTAL